MISIMAFPLQGDGYTECFYASLRQQGVRLYEGVFAGRWLLHHLRNIDYVHLHWPSFFYNRPRPAACLRAFALFLFLLLLARWRGARIIWTVHNLYPHDRCTIPVLDRLARQLLIKISCRFLVHGPSAAAAVLKEFPKMAGRIVLIDHGHWIGYYADTIRRDEARAVLGLPETAFVFLFVGLCKRYKNLEGLIAAFEHLPDHATLVIAGKFQNLVYERDIRTLIERSPAKTRIRMFAWFIPNNELQIYLRAANVVTAPYNEILTSGTAMLALSFGRPIVAPNYGFLRDAVGVECGILYDGQEKDGLARALVNAMNTNYEEGSIVEHALGHDWNKSATYLIAALAAR